MNKADMNLEEANSTAPIAANGGTHYDLVSTPSKSLSQQINSTNTCSEEPRCDFQQADLFSSCYEVNMTLKQDFNTNGIYVESNVSMEHSS